MGGQVVQLRASERFADFRRDLRLDAGLEPALHVGAVAMLLHHDGRDFVVQDVRHDRQILDEGEVVVVERIVLMALRTCFDRPTHTS